MRYSYALTAEEFETIHAVVAAWCKLHDIAAKTQAARNVTVLAMGFQRSGTKTKEALLEALSGFDPKFMDGGAVQSKLH